MKAPPGRCVMPTIELVRSPVISQEEVDARLYRAYAILCALADEAEADVDDMDSGQTPPAAGEAPPAAGGVERGGD